MALTNESIFSMFLPGIAGRIDSPEAKLPFHQKVIVYGQDFDIIQRQMIRICMWNKDNLSGAHWYIDAGALFGDFEATFEFNFSTEEDAMAFKLRWV